MTRNELNELVESLIVIKDVYDLSRATRDTISDACNVIYGNIGILADNDDPEPYVTVSPEHCSYLGCKCPYRIIECPECQVYKTVELARKKAGEKK